MTATDAELSAAVDRLRAGGLVAFPTETVYGLGADALNPDAVARVFAAKGRPSTNPLIVHVADSAMAQTLASTWPAIADRLAAAFWPGPLTLVLPKAAHIPAPVTAGGPTVAIRAPDHPIALELLRRFGGPLVGPSANRSGRVSPTCAQHVRDSFESSTVLVLDGGDCREGIESTVVDVSRGFGAPIEILRQGVLGPEELTAAAKRTVALAPSRTHPASGPAASPGLLAQHYAPAARTLLFRPDQWHDVLDAMLDADRPCVVISHAARPAPFPHRRIGMPADARGYARSLYAALRDADSGDPQFIAIERPTSDGAVWSAILDRLSRASIPFER